MRFVWATALKDLRRRWRDPLALVAWAAVPLLIALLIQLTFGGDGPQLEARLVITDLDDSFASQLLTSAYSQGALADMVDVSIADRAEGERRVRSGEASAALVIPLGFGRAVLDETPTTLELLKNPEQTILSGFVEELTVTFTDVAFYAQRLFGGSIGAIVDRADGDASAPADSFVVATSLAMNRTISALAPYAAPPVIELVATTGDDEADDDSTFGPLFLVGMLFLSLLFAAQGTSNDVWHEKQLGTLARALCSPHHAAALFAGKLVAAFVIFAGIAVFGLVAARLLFRLPLDNLWLAVPWAALFGILMYVLLSIVQMLASSERAAGVLVSIIIFPLGLLGGSFFPLEVMPAGLAAIGRLTPNGWALGHFKSIVFGTFEWPALIVAISVMLTAIVVASTLATQLMRRRFAL